MAVLTSPDSATPSGVAASADRFLDEIKDLGWTAFGASVLYAIFCAASRSGCFSDGPGDSSPTCVVLQLRPSPLIWSAIALVFLIGLGRASRARDVQTALRKMRIARIVIILLPIAAIALGIAWIMTMPLDAAGITPSGVAVPLGVTIDVSPMSRP